jgi:hypothetical protein
MGKASLAKKTMDVTLVRPDTGPLTFTIPAGATLADLLRHAGVGVRGPNIMIDGRPMEETVVLKSGMEVTFLPSPPEATSKRSWRDTVGMFADDPDFQAMVEAGRGIREADRTATLEEMDREEAARADS